MFNRGGDIPPGIVVVTSMIGTFGGASQLSNSINPNVSLTVNYRASVVVNGIERGAIEPYYSIGANFNSPFSVSSVDTIGSFVLTESQLTDNFAEILLEERYGYISCSYTSVSYTCQ